MFKRILLLNKINVFVVLNRAHRKETLPIMHLIIIKPRMHFDHTIRLLQSTTVVHLFSEMFLNNFMIRKGIVPNKNLLKYFYKNLNRKENRQFTGKLLHVVVRKLEFFSKKLF